MMYQALENHHKEIPHPMSKTVLESQKKYLQSSVNNIELPHIISNDVLAGFLMNQDIGGELLGTDYCQFRSLVGIASAALAQHQVSESELLWSVCENGGAI